MAEVETYYRNIDVGWDNEIAVKATRGYSLVVEVIIDGSPADVVVRLSPSGADALGTALVEASKTLKTCRQEKT